MARPIILSNGRMMVGLDEHGLVHDFYYPYVGQDNLTSARELNHKIGVWVDGEFSWVDQAGWQTELLYDEHALIGRLSFVNDELGIKLESEDYIDHQHDIFGRRFKVSNLWNKDRLIRLFFHQVFQISRTGRGDTAMYVPAKHPYLLIYRGNTSFACGVRLANGQSFDQHAVGNYRIEGKAGTFVDAEDGELSNSNVEHGGVDSVLRCSLSLGGNAATIVDYWVAASDQTYHQSSGLHRDLAVNSLSASLNATRQAWGSWLSKANPVENSLPEAYRSIFRTSLMLIRAHVDNGGGVLASGDSSIFNYGRDYYSYVWPRDAVYALMPLVRLGYSAEALKFLEFSSSVSHPRGYLHHKYQPNGAIGSTWHPMIQNGRPELNIQEDETAMVVILYAELCKILHADSPRMQEIYLSLIRPALNFLTSYVDDDSGLPHPSYDLWEERFVSSTYTAATVIAALSEGVEIARNRHDDVDAEKWQKCAASIRENYPKYFDRDGQYFAKGITLSDGKIVHDKSLDSSTFYALFKYQPLPLDQATVAGTFQVVLNRLVDKTAIGGVVRYENDHYMLKREGQLGNPWIVCTLWLAEYCLKAGHIDQAKHYIDWAIARAWPSGAMAEQVDPINGYGVGVTPLLWSHAELVSCLIDYQQTVTQ